MRTLLPALSLPDAVALVLFLCAVAVGRSHWALNSEPIKPESEVCFLGGAEHFVLRALHTTIFQPPSLNNTKFPLIPSLELFWLQST